MDQARRRSYGREFDAFIASSSWPRGRGELHRLMVRSTNHRMATASSAGGALPQVSTDLAVGSLGRWGERAKSAPAHSRDHVLASRCRPRLHTTYRSSSSGPRSGGAAAASTEQESNGQSLSLISRAFPVVLSRDPKNATDPTVHGSPPPHSHPSVRPLGVRAVFPDDDDAALAYPRSFLCSVSLCPPSAIFGYPSFTSALVASPPTRRWSASFSSTASESPRRHHTAQAGITSATSIPCTSSHGCRTRAVHPVMRRQVITTMSRRPHRRRLSTMTLLLLGSGTRARMASALRRPLCTGLPH